MRGVKKRVAELWSEGASRFRKMMKKVRNW